MPCPARDTTLNLFPRDFGSDYRLAETLTLPELNGLIHIKIECGANDTQTCQSDKYERDVYPIVILALIGVTLSARKARVGVGGQIAFVLAFVFIFFVMFSRNLAQVG